MNIEIVKVERKDKEILREMLRDYEKEITDGKDGEYKYFDSYWEKENRWPFFIKVDEKIAGFVLVNQHNLVEPEAKNLSEFYVKKEYRGQRVGLRAAIKVFEIFPGKWEIRQMIENQKAHVFWLKVLSEYTRGKFKETKMDYEKWRGWIQTFESGHSSDIYG